MSYSFVRFASCIAVRSTIAFLSDILAHPTVLVLILVLIPLARKGILDSCIQLLCCIVSHLFLSVVNSCRFANNCQVSAGTDRNVVADNLAIICEAAAVNHRQKKMGYNAAQELYTRVQNSLARKRNEDEDEDED